MVGAEVKGAPPMKLFYSYSHKDEELREQLETHLSILRRQGVISTWHFRKITAGTEWESAIDQHLNSADIILLLISPDFLNSDYCYDVEMRRALERHNAGEARVIPVILRPVLWEGAPFGKLQALPDSAKPVTTWTNQDEAFKDVARGILAATRELRDQRSAGRSDTVAQMPAGVATPDPRSPAPPENLATLPEPYVAALGTAATPEAAIAAFARAHFPEYELVGACEDARLNNDEGKLCYTLQTAWTNLRAYWLGRTFSGSLMWVFLARNEGQWSVFATATEPQGRGGGAEVIVPEAIGPNRTAPEVQALLHLYHRGTMLDVPSPSAIGEAADAEWQSAFGPELTAAQWDLVVRRLVALELVSTNAGMMHYGFSLTTLGVSLATALTPRHFQDYRGAGDVEGWQFHLPARPYRTQHVTDADGQVVRLSFLDELAEPVGPAVAKRTGQHRTRVLLHRDDEYLFSVAGPILEETQSFEADQAVLVEAVRRLRKRGWEPGATYLA